MTLEEVNHRYEQIINSPSEPVSIQFVHPFIMYIVLALVCIFICVLVGKLIYRFFISKTNRKQEQTRTQRMRLVGEEVLGILDGASSFILHIIVILFFLSVVTTFGKYVRDTVEKNDIQSANLEQWKTEIAIPYIESLPIERHRIVYIKIDPEIKTEIKGNFILGSGGINTTSTPLTALTLSYQNGKKLITETNWYDSQMNLTSDKEPYIEYRDLKEVLGDGDILPKGHYNATVFLPEGYRFDTIK